MSAQRYERISAPDDEADDTHISSTNSPRTPYDNPSHTSSHNLPNSPPPSFRSRASSFGANSHLDRDRQPLVDRTLADTFETSSSDEEDDDDTNHMLDERQRVMSGRPVDAEVAMTEDGSDNVRGHGRRTVERLVTQLPVFAPASARSGRVYGGGGDGVFANLSAKPGVGGNDLDEKPPTYEQAAADAAPPYWETTILAPGGHNPDDVFIDGLPVGSLFSFVWNAMISMSFQLVGFLLTYLLHTTHAAKNGSKAGLGITLVQYGFTMKGASSIPRGGSDGGTGGGEDGNGADFVQPPSDPNTHDFDPTAPIVSSILSSASSNSTVPDSDGGVGVFGNMAATDYFAYALMILGWFILIKSISDYLKARRHEQLVLQSPERGLNVAVVAEGEAAETVV